MAPKLSIGSHIVLRAEPQYYETYVAFDYEKTQTEFLNKDGFDILQYLSGRSADIKEVARETKVNFDKCKKFLKRAEKLGFAEKNEKAANNCTSKSEKASYRLFNEFQVPFLTAPSSVDVFITSRCNLKCVHCFSTTEKPLDLSLEDLKSIFDQLEEMRVLEVRINGGEPLLHPSIGEILQTLESRRFRKVMLTNGTLLNDKIAEQLKISNITPTVSLDDSGAQVNDLFRGVEGTFEKALSGLKTLKRNKVQYGINCCLHAKNLNNVNKIVNLAENQGACRIAFLDLKPLGHMKKHREWMPSQKEYDLCMANLLTLRAKHRRIDVSLDAFQSCSIMKESVLEAEKGYVSCRAGRTTMSIFSDGYVYPCNSAVGDSKWKIGNFKRIALKDIWFSKKWAFFRGAIKTSNLHKCRYCKDIKQCRDFYCRLIPYAMTGDPYGPSIRCGSA